MSGGARERLEPKQRNARTRKESSASSCASWERSIVRQTDGTEKAARQPRLTARQANFAPMSRHGATRCRM